MTTVLGIHCGHESSCSVVRDGQLLSAVQQERVTRRKYDGQEFLSDRLPIREVLRLAGTTIDEVDVIVSSFQAAGPSGVGLQRPLVASAFSAFDPFDPRHHVVSHHLAHAASAVYPSGLAAAAVLVSDSAGTTSWDGKDFYEPFADFHARYYADVDPAGRAVFTEMRSVYSFADGRFTLLDRAYSTPHNQPDVFVQSEAGLFDNVSRYVFRAEHAHGQLMALAGLPPTGPVRLTGADIVTQEGPPRLKNGWQLIDGPVGGDPVDSADLAAAVQDAFTRLLTHHAQRAVDLAGTPNLCCAGGVFLNLTANSAIAALPGVRDMYVPSCPHDAGISVGAAFLGWARRQPGRTVTTRIRNDFLGRPAEPVTPELAAEYGCVPVPVTAGVRGAEATAGAPAEAGAVSDLTRAAAGIIAGGAVVARFAGRAEFGPRALGNRSLICHPVACSDARAKLNRLKRRQDWRPVAPIVRAQDLDTYFHGPAESPFMNFNFEVREEYRELLAEALHADGTARVQTVTPDCNPAVHELLTAIAGLGLPPILINTSLNGPAQPIIDSAADVLEFVRHPVVDYLLGDDFLFATPGSGPLRVRRPESVVMASFGSGPTARYVLSSQTASSPVDRQLFQDLCAQDRVLADSGSRLVLDCLNAGLLVEADR
ncbi:carbamoyltransferase C-terminal domain-containing protein [Streptomyces sp. NPDC058290]|uniref:carbamoyltransferase C-terminal domain-containing protein n=1 Tax=Streptomyces sp. NPDC058290 TaxID=3346426 RepID=UPI0036E17552